jgi:hypothetical protein
MQPVPCCVPWAMRCVAMLYCHYCATLSRAETKPFCAYCYLPPGTAVRCGTYRYPTRSEPFNRSSAAHSSCLLSALARQSVAKYRQKRDDTFAIKENARRAVRRPAHTRALCRTHAH